MGQSLYVKNRPTRRESEINPKSRSHFMSHANRNQVTVTCIRRWIRRRTRWLSPVKQIRKIGMINRPRFGSLKNCYLYRWVLLSAVMLGLLALSLLIAIQPALSDARVPEPGEPPVAPAVLPIVQSPRMFLTDTIEIFLPVVIRPNSFTVNPQDRGILLSFYQSQYLMASNPPINWTGADASVILAQLVPTFVQPSCDGLITSVPWQVCQTILSSAPPPPKKHRLRRL